MPLRGFVGLLLVLLLSACCRAADGKEKENRLAKSNDLPRPHLEICRETRSAPDQPPQSDAHQPPPPRTARELRLVSAPEHSTDAPQTPTPRSSQADSSPSLRVRLRSRFTGPPQTIHWLRVLGEDVTGRVQFQLEATTWRPGDSIFPSYPTRRPREEPIYPERARTPGSEARWRAYAIPVGRLTWRRLTPSPHLATQTPVRRPGNGGRVPPGRRTLLPSQVWDVMFNLPEHRLRLSEVEEAQVEGYLENFWLPAEPAPPRVRRELELRRRSHEARLRQETISELRGFRDTGVGR